MSKRAEKMKERMRRRGEAAHAKKDPKKRLNLDFQVEITINQGFDLADRIREIEMRLGEVLGGPKKFRIRVDTN